MRRAPPILDLGRPGALRVVGVGCAIAIVASAWWALFGAKRSGGEFVTGIAELSLPSESTTSPAEQVEQGGLALADAARARGTALWGELFPAPPPVVAPPPPPTLALELVAITGKEGSRRVFVYDKATQAYLDLGVGEAVAVSGGSSARLTTVGDRFALFDLLGREVRLELAP